MDLSLFFAGTAGSVPTARRGLPALLMRRGGDRLLFDCGEGTRDASRDAQLLVHDGSFAEREADRAAETGHSTARQAAEIARDAGVRLLALTHLSTRYGGGEIRDEARAVFERTVVPRDFDAIEVPFPEKGEPALERFEPPERARV